MILCAAARVSRARPGVELSTHLGGLGDVASYTDDGQGDDDDTGLELLVVHHGRQRVGLRAGGVSCGGRNVRGGATDRQHGAALGRLHERQLVGAHVAGAANDTLQLPVLRLAEVQPDVERVHSVGAHGGQDVDAREVRVHDQPAGDELLEAAALVRHELRAGVSARRERTQQARRAPR